MSIVDVEIVLLPEEAMRLGLAAEIADRCGQVFDSPPGSTWVKLRAIPCDHYAESGGGPPDGVCPVFVSVLKARLPAPDALRVEVARLSAAIAEAAGQPGGKRPHRLFARRGRPRCVRRRARVGRVARCSVQPDFRARARLIGFILS